MTTPDRAAPRTEAGRVLLHEHSSGTPHMARHIVAIEREAAAAPALDVERLRRQFRDHAYPGALGHPTLIQWWIVEADSVIDEWLAASPQDPEPGTEKES